MAEQKKAAQPPHGRPAGQRPAAAQNRPDRNRRPMTANAVRPAQTSQRPAASGRPAPRPVQARSTRPGQPPAVGHPIKNPPLQPLTVVKNVLNREKVLAPKLKIYALGGLEEIGRNCTVFECGADIVIIDIGLMFPEEGMPGIDYIIPNISSLKGKEQNIRGVLVTHGHMDHVGGIPLTMPKLGWPTIFTTPLTAGIIRKRQEEFRNEKSLKIQMVKPGQKIQLGRHFVFEPFHINHNISDAFGAALHTPYGTIIYTGDFKFDFTPVMDEPADLPYIAQFGARGVLAMMSDSTNAESPGFQMSEKAVGAEMNDIFQKAKGRLIIGTFSSLLTRVQQILSLSEQYGRKVIVEGRSMKNIIELAHSLGYLKFKPGTIVDDKSAKRLPDHQIAIVCTGAQGEKNAALMKIANREHRTFQVKKGDSIVFSSSVIPGNERTVQNLKDTLVRQGAHIFHYKNLDVHAGGHAKQEDLKLMMRLIKPEYLIPIHGNRFMLEAHAELAREVGVPEDKVLVSENGRVIEFDQKGGRLTDVRVDTDYVMVDGLGVGDVSEVVLRDRRMLAEDGIFVVIATLDKRTGKLVGSPDIISRGFVYMQENRELITQAREKVKKVLKDNNPQGPAFEEHLRNKLRNEVGAYLFKVTERRPMILPVIIEV